MAQSGTQLDDGLGSTAPDAHIYVLDPESGELRGGGLQVRLGPRPAQVLAYLADRPGELVTRDDLLTHVWRGAAVTDDAVWKAIANLRKSLADPRDRPRFVETLPRRGYRLIAKVDVASAGSVSPVATAIEDTARHRSSRFQDRPRRLLVGVALVGLSSLALAAWVSDVPWYLPETQSVAAQTKVSPSPRRQEAARLVAVADEFLKRADRPSLQHATRLYERAIEIDRTHAPGFSGLANSRALEALRFAGRREQLLAATEDARRAIALDPALSNAHVALGIAAVGLDQNVVAREAFATALRADPDNPRARLNLSVVERLGGRPDLAIERVKFFEPDTPERWAIHNLHLARCYFLLGDLASSFELLHEALEMVPEDPGATLELARQEWLSGRPEAAMKILGPMLREPQSPARHLAGLIAVSEGKLAEGLGWLESLANPEALLYSAFARSQLALSPTSESPQRVDPAGDGEALRAPSDQRWQSRWLAARLAWLEGDEDQGWSWLDQAIGHGFLDGLLVAADPIVRKADPSGSQTARRLARIDRRRSELLMGMGRPEPRHR